MATTERVLKTTPDRVWAVLADGWLYPAWVVGASRMRTVDADWPAVGSTLHHSIGAWPALLDDTTTVAVSQPTRRLVLTATGWPLGEARVDLTLEPAGETTRVVIEEDAVAGPGALVPRPLRTPGIRWRNVETLRRLAYLAERRP